MAFPENELYRTLTDKLMQEFGDSPKGTLITYSQITELIGYGRSTKEGAAILGKFKLALRKLHVVRCVDGVGVLILDDTDAAERVPVERAKRSYRQAGKGIRELEKVDGAKLSDHLRRACFMASEKLRFLRLMAGRAKRAHEQESRATDTMPKRPKPK